MSKAIKKLYFTILTFLCVLACAFGTVFAVSASAEGEAFDASAYAPSDIFTTDGASVRPDNVNTTEKDETGIRFPIVVNREAYNTMVETAETAGYTAELWVSIIPTVVLGENELTASAESYVYNETTYDVKRIQLIELYATETVTPEGGEAYTLDTYYATLTDIPGVNYETELSAIGYVKFSKDGADDQYLETDTVTRSIGQVITAWYFETDEEIAPTATQKTQLEQLIDERIRPSLAEKLDDGYVADFSSSSYRTLVNKFDYWNAPEVTYLPNGDEKVSESVLKIYFDGNLKENASGFVLKLPQEAGQNKLQLRMWSASVSPTDGLNKILNVSFLKPNTTSDTLVEYEDDSATRGQWKTYSLDYTALEQTDELIVKFLTTGSDRKVTFYLDWIMVDPFASLGENVLADFSSSVYTSLVSGLNNYGEPVVTYLPEGHTSVTDGALKIELTTANVDGGAWAGFKLNLPKTAPNGSKLKVKLYIQCDYSTGIYICDGKFNRLTADGTNKIDITTKGGWVEQTVDCSACTDLDELIFRAYTGSVNRKVTIYLALVEVAEN